MKEGERASASTSPKKNFTFFVHFVVWLICKYIITSGFGLNISTTHSRAWADSWIKYLFSWLRGASERRKKKKIVVVASEERKIHFAPRLNVTHKKNKFIICTSDIFIRAMLFVYQRRTSLISAERVSPIHSPNFEGTTRVETVY